MENKLNRAIVAALAILWQITTKTHFIAPKTQPEKIALILAGQRVSKSCSIAVKIMFHIHRFVRRSGRNKTICIGEMSIDYETSIFLVQHIQSHSCHWRNDSQCEARKKEQLQQQQQNVNKIWRRSRCTYILNSLVAIN